MQISSKDGFVSGFSPGSILLKVWSLVELWGSRARFKGNLRSLRPSFVAGTIAVFLPTKLRT